jgi:hypothetical protein
MVLADPERKKTIDQERSFTSDLNTDALGPDCASGYARSK